MSLDTKCITLWSPKFRTANKNVIATTKPAQKFLLINSRILAERTGLEPATPGVTGRYSNQLNYRSNFLFYFFVLLFDKK